ncbi:MAG: T9SS type A sorting domain-containing protein [Bacteroidota bacterium]
MTVAYAYNDFQHYDESDLHTWYGQKKRYRAGKPKYFTAKPHQLPQDDLTIKLFPNPNYGMFYLELYTPVEKDITVTVFDIGGKEYGQYDAGKTGNNLLKINMTELRTGVYFIRISTQEKNYCKKIVIL